MLVFLLERIRSRTLRGTIPKTNEIVTHIVAVITFPLSSVQIIIIPACCLLCVL